MDTEFINRYIQRQTDLIQDLIKKNLMLEVQLSLANDQVALLNKQVQELSGPVVDNEIKSEEKHKTPKKVAADENF